MNARPDLTDPALLAELRRVAETVAREAGALVREHAAQPVSVADRKTSRTDVVTAADHAAEELLGRRLRELRPDDGFLGEEGGQRASATGITWVVDPIDGTVNFLYGIPQYAVCVAAVDDDEVSLAGAVLDVTRDQLYAAARGQGATLDGVPLAVREVAPMNERLVVTGFQYQQRIRELQGDAVRQLLSRVRDVRRQGSAALDLCTVAAGRADAYIEEGLHLWDRAAASLVAEEAGARVSLHTGVGGMEAVLCTPADGHDDTLAVITECGFLAPVDDRRPEGGPEGLPDALG
ncbi:inositol monophosphatase [Nocardioides sp. HDW12B]|uniref:inositol monophosphatase family protein n=1 Tax=Nocardioides sp. HDW12B TaxID=2714939 RepID=UPI001408E7A1|nr:inositol monophosphatase family protein [Nocardioides sp. HDW12B]QIK66756.1 inositol monophosphatase [Nocardioides sp. HDW12B]